VEWAWGLLAVVAAGGLLLVRGWLARRRNRRVLGGDGAVSRRALLARGREPLRRGQLELTRTTARWWDRREVLELGAARVVGVTMSPGGWRVRPDDLLVRLELADGTPARLVLHAEHGRLLDQVLGEPDPDRRALPPLTEEEVRPGRADAGEWLGRLAPYALRQLPDGGWASPRRPAGSRPAQLRWIARNLVAPLVVLTIAIGITAPWPYRWLVLHRSATATTTATSTGERVAGSEGRGPLPDDLTVTFADASGRQHRADVTTRANPPAGTIFTIRYAVDRPGWARLVGPADDLGWAALVALIATVLGAGWLAVTLTAAVTALRSIIRTRTAVARPALALLTADRYGEPVLLACDPLATPLQLVAIPLRRPLPHDAAAAFANGPVEVSARGALTAGSAVLTELPTDPPAVLVPAGPAEILDPADVVALLDTAALLRT
jgi:hypothetical protein